MARSQPGRLDHGRANAPTFYRPRLVAPSAASGGEPTPDPTPDAPQSGDVLLSDTFPTDGPLTTTETGQAWTQVDDWSAFPQSDSGVHSGVLVTEGWASFADAGATDIDLTVTLGTYVDTFYLPFRATGTTFGNRLMIIIDSGVYTFQTEYSNGVGGTVQHLYRSSIAPASGDVIHVLAVGNDVSYSVNGVAAVCYLTPGTNAPVTTFDDSTRTGNIAHTGTMIGFGDWDNAVANTLASVVVRVP